MRSVGKTGPVSGLLVISGPPGAGKSTVAAAVAERLQPCALVGADAFFAFLRGGIEPWTVEADEQNGIVIRATSAAAGRFAEGMPTVYDGVVGPWFLEELLAGTGLADLDYAVLLPSVDVCLQRVAGRRNHGFTDAGATRHMHDQFASVSIQGRHRFDSAAPIDQLVDQVLAARSAGTLRWSSGA